MYVPRLRALLLSALFLPTLAAARDGAPPASLQSLVEQAWLRAPSGRGIVARQGEIDAARAQAGTWVAGQPVLGMSHRSGRWSEPGGARESELSMSAPFYTPGQRSARHHLAEVSASELDAQVRKVRLDIAGEVRTRLWDAAAAQAVLEEKEGHLHHTEELAAEVERRVRGGELARVDALLAQQEVQSARIAVEQARAESHASLSRLRLLVGPVAALPLEPEPLSPAAAGNVRLQAARATETRAEAALRLARASRNGPPSLALSVRQEREPLVAGQDRSLGLSLQIPIGSAGRNRLAEAQAQTQMAVAAAEARLAEEAIASDLALARLQVEHARAALAIAQARVNAMREHQQLIEKAFKLGERGLAELLRSHALAHEAQVAQRQQQVALGRAHAQFNQASGVMP